MMKITINSFPRCGFGNRILYYYNLKLKEKPTVLKSTCAIHFRGTDFHQWNPNAVLGFDYYYDSIEEVRGLVDSFALFTDDPNLPSVTMVKEHLSSQGINFTEGGRENYINDFSFMSECDYIISSPSTFCICAGFIGKQKKIIHSKNWVEDRASKNDKFWVDLLNGGNEDYSIWRLI